MCNYIFNFCGTGYQSYSLLVLVSCDAVLENQETGELLKIHISFHFP